MQQNFYFACLVYNSYRILFILLLFGQKGCNVDKKLPIPNPVLQSLLRPFFIALPPSTALNCSLRVLELLVLDNLIVESQHVYLRSLVEAYRDILSD